MTTKPDRKQVGVHVDVELWRKFRAKAVEEGKRTGELLEEVLKLYLQKADRKKPSKFQV